VSLSRDGRTHDITSDQKPTRVVSYTKTRIAVTDGPGPRLSIESTGGAVRVGSASDNALVIADHTVSRYHCEIVPRLDGIWVRDAGSTNGLFHGEIRVIDAVFSGPFQLRLGNSTLTVTPLVDTVEKVQSVDDRFGDLLGQSACMRELFADLMRIAPSDVNVLISGETGTGKELVADAIHRASSRADGPYVVFDCSAVAPTLIESELFGHERGAFTGAQNARAGVFEQADGGTIFLDELGELPKELQPKLLRVLEKREVRRVGSNQTLSVDVRLVAASNRDLTSEVQRGNFREDLYFRVATTQVSVPPLRDRLDDLTLLVGHLLEQTRPLRLLEDIPEHVWEMFRAHRWPGNVRELHNAVQRLVIMPERALTTSAVLGTPQTTAAPKPKAPIEPLRVARREAADEFERTYLERVLEETSGNISRAAAIAEVSRQMMHKLLRKYGP